MGRLAFVLLALLAGCGGGTTTTTHTPTGSGGSGGTVIPPTPTLHVIYPDTIANPQGAATGLSYGAFTLPTASVSYMITERTTTTTQDTWTTAIVSSSELARANAGQDYRGYAISTMHTGTVSATATVPADVYNLVVFCDNILEDCVYSYQLSATY
jgi:hypothetical protein